MLKLSYTFNLHPCSNAVTTTWAMLITMMLLMCSDNASRGPWERKKWLLIRLARSVLCFKVRQVYYSDSGENKGPCAGWNPAKEKPYRGQQQRRSGEWMSLIRVEWGRGSEKVNGRQSSRGTQGFVLVSMKTKLPCRSEMNTCESRVSQSFFFVFWLRSHWRGFTFEFLPLHYCSNDGSFPRTIRKVTFNSSCCTTEKSGFFLSVGVFFFRETRLVSSREWFESISDLELRRRRRDNCCASTRFRLSSCDYHQSAAHPAANGGSL